MLRNRAGEGEERCCWVSASQIFSGRERQRPSITSHESSVRSRATTLCGRGRRGERSRSNYQEIVIHTSPQGGARCVLSIRTRFFVIDNGGFDPAAHRSRSNRRRNKSGSSHKQGSTGRSWPWPWKSLSHGIVWSLMEAGVGPGGGGFSPFGAGCAVVLITTRQGGRLFEASSSLDRAHYQDQMLLFPLALGSSEVLPGPLGHGDVS